MNLPGRPEASLDRDPGLVADALNLLPPRGVSFPPVPLRVRSRDRDQPESWSEFWQMWFRFKRQSPLRRGNAPNRLPNATGSLGDCVEPRIVHILDKPMSTRQLARSNANRVCWAMTPVRAVRQIGSRQRVGVSPMTQSSDWHDAMGCRGARACGRSSGVTMVMGPAGAD